MQIYNNKWEPFWEYEILEGVHFHVSYFMMEIEIPRVWS